MFGENILYKEKISAAATVVDVVVVVVSAVRDSYKIGKSFGFIPE